MVDNHFTAPCEMIFAVINLQFAVVDLQFTRISTVCCDGFTKVRFAVK